MEHVLNILFSDEVWKKNRLTRSMKMHTRNSPMEIKNRDEVILPTPVKELCASFFNSVPNSFVAVYQVYGECTRSNKI